MLRRLTVLLIVEFNSVLNRLADMTTANVDSMQVYHNTWISQIKDAMNVNGGDIENATSSDYVMHFLTFGWKVYCIYFSCGNGTLIKSLTSTLSYCSHLSRLPRYGEDGYHFSYRWPLLDC